MGNNFGAPWKSIILRQGLKINIPVLLTGEMGFCTDTFEIAVGSASGNQFFSFGSSGQYVVFNSFAAPAIIDPAVGIIPANVRRQLRFVKGRVGMGGELITAAPAIGPGFAVGDELAVTGCLDADYPILSDGGAPLVSGLIQNGDLDIKKDRTRFFFWNGSYWNARL